MKKNYYQTYGKQWQKENKDKMYVSYRKWYEKNKEKALLARKKWYENNKEKMAEYARSWRKINSEKVKEYSRYYYYNIKVPEKIKEKNKTWGQYA